VAGILASVDGNALVTGASWRCTANNLDTSSADVSSADTSSQTGGSIITNWFATSFNDSSWPAAIISGTNTVSDSHGYLSQISSNARWIWTSNYQGRSCDQTVYCRGVVGKYLVQFISFKPGSAIHA